MRNFHLFLLALSGILWGIALPAQDAGPEAEEGRPLSFFEYIYQREDSLPLLQLDTDWGQLIRKKMDEEYQPGVLKFRQEDGSMARLDVRIRTRGNIRKEVCFFPPLKIKAKKKQLK